MASRTYLGVPFHHAGRSREGGIDCAGLIACCLRDLDIPFEDFQAYRFGSEMYEEFARRLCGPFEPCDLDDAEIVLLRSRRIPCHAAVLTSVGTMIHVMAGGKCVEEDLEPRAWGPWHEATAFRLLPEFRPKPAETSGAGRSGP